MTPARAVILFGSGDPTANTSAPGGTLAGSGWQYEGQFGGFLGTAIASNFFVTAKHIGGSVGDTFTFNGVNYTTVAVFPDPSSDLQIWQVAGSFPSHASLFSEAPGTEVNFALVVFGRGTQRGDPVLVGNDSHLGGWLWGASDSVQRWGTNVISSIETDPTYGKLLRAPFDSNAGTNEAHLSAGDSGGAVFVFNSATSRWELAGINLAVDGPFSASSSGANAFNAAMFDTIGLFGKLGGRSKSERILRHGNRGAQRLHRIRSDGIDQCCLAQDARRRRPLRCRSSGIRNTWNRMSQWRRHQRLHTRLHVRTRRYGGERVSLHWRWKCDELQCRWKPGYGKSHRCHQRADNNCHAFECE